MEPRTGEVSISQLDGWMMELLLETPRQYVKSLWYPSVEGGLFETVYASIPQEIVFAPFCVNHEHVFSEIGVRVYSAPDGIRFNKCAIYSTGVEAKPLALIKDLGVVMPPAGSIDSLFLSFQLNQKLEPGLYFMGLWMSEGQVFHKASNSYRWGASADAYEIVFPHLIPSGGSSINQSSVISARGWTLNGWTDEDGWPADPSSLALSSFVHPPIVWLKA